MHRRKLQIEEDEAKIKQEKQRIQFIESKNIGLTKELEEMIKEFKELKKVHERVNNEYQELKE